MRAPWLLAGLLVAGAAMAAPSLQQLWGLRYYTAPTLSDRQQTPWRGDSTGKLEMNGISTSCSNSLDFSDGCNSQYLVLFKGGI